MTADHRNMAGGVPERHDYSLGLNCGSFLRAAWAAARMKTALPRGAKVLEVGCGLGWASGVFAALGYDLLSIDSSEDALSEARRRNPGLRFERADAADFTRPGEYDAVLAFEVIEHLKDPGRAAENWKTSLKPGGWLFLSTPNRRYNMDNPLKPGNPHHLREFSAGELRGFFPGCELRGINLFVSGALRWNSAWMRAAFYAAAVFFSFFEDRDSYPIEGRALFSRREMAYHLMGRKFPEFSDGLWLAWRKPE